MHGESITQGTSRKLDKKSDKAIIAVLSLAVFTLLFNQFVLPRFASAPETASNEKSIAFLPFEKLDSDRDNACFAVGVQDEILTRLAKIAALKVISRTSTMHDASSRRTCRRLPANWVSPLFSKAAWSGVATRSASLCSSFWRAPNACAITELQQVLKRRDRLDQVLLTRILAQLGRAELLSKDREAGSAYLIESCNITEAGRASDNSSPWDCLGLVYVTGAIGDSEAADHYAEL